MELKEILSKINSTPKEIMEFKPFGNTYFFKFSRREHFNVNGLIIRCNRLNISNTGLEFYSDEASTLGRYVHTDSLDDIKSFYHYL